jgi:phage tail sheath protein FI
MHGYVAVEEVNSGGTSPVGISVSITRELIECWCVTQLQWVAYETNNASPLWDQVVQNIRGYLLALWATGMLRGDTTKESFVVKCDQTTMTQADIREGNLICQIGVAPVKASEFVHYRIRIRLKPREYPSRQGVRSLLA